MQSFLAAERIYVLPFHLKILLSLLIGNIYFNEFGGAAVTLTRRTTLPATASSRLDTSGLRSPSRAKPHVSCASSPGVKAARPLRPP